MSTVTHLRRKRRRETGEYPAVPVKVREKYCSLLLDASVSCRRSIDF